MAVGCGANFAKIMLIIFNIIFLCSGLVLIALGIWLLVILAQSEGIVHVFSGVYGSSFYRNAAILLIAMGCLILFVTILGLVAAIRESKILLTIFLVFILIIFAGEIAGGVVAIVYKDRLLDRLENYLRDTLRFPAPETYYENSTKCESYGNGLVWDLVQKEFGCCGIEMNYTGYGSVSDRELNQCSETKALFPNLRVPLTCCYLRNESDFQYDNQKASAFECPSTPYPLNKLGCTQAVKNWIIKYAPVLIGIGIGFGMLEMFGIIFIVCLCMNTDKGFSRF